MVGFVFSDVHGQKIVRLLRYLKWHFAPEATQEILDEFRPLLCPFDMSMLQAVSFLTLLLPTRSQHPAEKTYQLWFREFLEVWAWEDCNPVSELMWMHLYSELARWKRGLIDWNPYLHILFTRIAKVVDVPVGTLPRGEVRRMGATSGQGIFALDPDPGGGAGPAIPAASLIINMLGPGSNCQEHLDTLFNMLRAYFHPSNSGYWSPTLGIFIEALSRLLVLRLHDEQLPHCEVPKDKRLREQDVVGVIRTLMPALSLAIFSKSSHLANASRLALRSLASIRPDMIIPNILQRAERALTTLTETHQTIAVLHTLEMIAPVLFNRTIFPESGRYLAQLLQLTLPGIDNNDLMKTLSVFGFYSLMLSHIPIIDGAHRSSSDSSTPPTDWLPENRKKFSAWLARFDRLRAHADERARTIGLPLLAASAGEHADAPDSPPSADGSARSLNSLEELDAEARSATGFFEDWLIQLFDRSFTLLSYFTPLKMKGGRDASRSFQLFQVLRPTFILHI